MKTNEYLPIGSVVLVKEAEKKLMIIGIMPKSGEMTKDYIGVIYPEGYLDNEHFYMFDHSDIVEVSYIGLIDAEQQMFRVELDKMLNEHAND